MPTTAAMRATLTTTTTRSWTLSGQREREPTNTDGANNSGDACDADDDNDTWTELTTVRSKRSRTRRTRTAPTTAGRRVPTLTTTTTESVRQRTDNCPGQRQSPPRRDSDHGGDACDADDDNDDLEDPAEEPTVRSSSTASQTNTDGAEAAGRVRRRRRQRRRDRRQRRLPARPDKSPSDAPPPATGPPPTAPAPPVEPAPSTPPAAPAASSSPASQHSTALAESLTATRFNRSAGTRLDFALQRGCEREGHPHRRAQGPAHGWALLDNRRARQALHHQAQARHAQLHRCAAAPTRSGWFGRGLERGSYKATVGRERTGKAAARPWSYSGSSCADERQPDGRRWSPRGGRRALNRRDHDRLRRSRPAGR